MTTGDDLCRSDFVATACQVVDAEQLLREKRERQAQDIEDLRSGKRTQAEMLLFAPGEAQAARVLNGPY